MRVALLVSACVALLGATAQSASADEGPSWLDDLVPRLEVPEEIHYTLWRKGPFLGEVCYNWREGKLKGFFGTDGALTIKDATVSGRSGVEVTGDKERLTDAGVRFDLDSPVLDVVFSHSVKGRGEVFLDVNGKQILDRIWGGGPD